MSSLQPEGNAIRQAVRWISEHLKEDPAAVKQELIHQAISKFDLSPKDSMALMNFYANPPAPSDSPPKK